MRAGFPVWYGSTNTETGEIEMGITYKITEERLRYTRDNDVREISVVDSDFLFSELEACGVPRRFWNFGPGASQALNGRFIRWEQNR